MINSTKSAPSEKPAHFTKPYADFPLSFHPPSGRLYKKIQGTRYYFGYASDWQAALKKYNQQRDYLFAGEEPPADDAEGHYSLEYLCNSFLERKDAQCREGTLTRRSFMDLRKSCQRMCNILGKTRRLDTLTIAHFERLRDKLSETLGVASLANELTRVRMVLKYACPKLTEKPLPYDEALKKPRKEAIRQAEQKAKRKNGAKMFEAAEVRRILKAAGPQWRAMVYLGINAGCGNSDLGQLTFADLDLEKGWLDYPRPKTSVDRRAKLWPETIAAIREWLAVRPEPKSDDDKDLVFITCKRESWHKDSTANPVACEFRKLLDRIDAAGKVQEKLQRPGRAFYAIRHTYRTVADETLDRSAIDLTMGHADHTMGGRYRERIDDRRLEAIADRVHQWLLSATTE